MGNAQEIRGSNQFSTISKGYGGTEGFEIDREGDEK